MLTACSMRLYVHIGHTYIKVVDCVTTPLGECINQHVAAAVCAIYIYIYTHTHRHTRVYVCAERDRETDR